MSLGIKDESVKFLNVQGQRCTEKNTYKPQGPFDLVGNRSTQLIAL